MAKFKPQEVVIDIQSGEPVKIIRLMGADDAGVQRYDVVFRISTDPEQWGTVKLTRSETQLESKKKTPTSRYILDIIAARTPKEHVNTKTAAFLDLAEVIAKTGKLHMELSEDSKEYPLRKEWYERATGKDFLPQTKQQPNQPLKINCTFPITEAKERGLPIYKKQADANAAGDGVFYLTWNFNIEEEKAKEVLVGGRRQEIGEFVVEKLGMCIGGPEDQDQALISGRIAEMRKKLEDDQKDKDKNKED
jgi:hypothetical protein